MRLFRWVVACLVGWRERLERAEVSEGNFVGLADRIEVVRDKVGHPSIRFTLIRVNGQTEFAFGPGGRFQGLRQLR